ncbi:hypothetical protein SEA_RUBYRALPH_34 [Microbacterium phage RubyRalph]|nr:hypothetical protein SEA_RUBYRALPH_34 [Microbacterium phage RubyRalph]
MPNILEDQLIYPVLAELRSCLCAQLGDTAPCFCGIVMGEDIPVDYVGGEDCSDTDSDGIACGAAYVRVANAYPTENFPEPLTRPTCNSVMAYTVYVGVIRCIGVGDEDGGPISQEELQLATERQLSDMLAMRNAIQCCLNSAFPEVDHVLGVFSPIAQEGDVVGGEWPVTLLERF